MTPTASVPWLTPDFATASVVADVEMSSPGRIQLATHSAKPLMMTRTMKDRMRPCFHTGLKNAGAPRTNARQCVVPLRRAFRVGLDWAGQVQAGYS